MQLTEWILLAQTATDPISGGAGWVGAGLLGGVLGWLLFVHLPNKDKQLKEIMESKDAHAREMMKEFRLDLVKVVEHCQAESIKLTEAFHVEMAAIRTEIAQPIARMMAKMERSDPR